MRIINLGNIIFTSEDIRVEKDIEKEYQKIIEKQLKNKFEFSFSKSSHTDGILEIDKDLSYFKKLYRLKIISEFKRGNYEYSILLGCICQCLFYILNMKNEFEEHSLKKYPDLVFIGFSDYFFITHIKNLERYLNHNDLLTVKNGTEAFKLCYNLKKQLDDDKSVEIGSYDFDNLVNCNKIFEKLYTSNTPLRIPFNIDTSSTVKCEFESLLLDKTLKSEQIASLLLSLFINPEGNYLDNKDNNLLHTQFSDFPIIKVDGKSLLDFKEKYKMDEKSENDMISTQHILFSKPDKVGKGQFYTPLLIANDAHYEISKAMNDINWRKDTIVIDNSCGTANLTRSFNDYKNLFLFTLLKSDIELMKSYNINITEMDFLDDLGPEVISNEKYWNTPKSYCDLLNIFNTMPNERYLIFNNPPFRGTDQEIEEKKSKNLISEIMIHDGIKGCTKQLFSGFLYRFIKIKESYKLDNLFLAFYCKATFFQSYDFETLRERFLRNFQFLHGSIFESKEFLTDENWPVCFSIWKSGKDIGKKTFLFNVKIIENNKIKTIDSVNLYQTSRNISIDKKNYNASLWANNIRSSKKIKMLPLLKGFNKYTGEDKVSINSFGCLQNHSNNIGSSIKLSSIYSGIPNDSKIEINEENLFNVCSLFTARRLSTKIHKEWYKETYEFTAPTDCQEFKIWSYNSLIFSLFSNQSHQSSLRNLNLPTCNFLINEFFWIPRNKVEDINYKENNRNIIIDLNSFPGERIISKKIIDLLEMNVLYSESIELITYIENLIIKTYNRREYLYINSITNFIEYHLMSWDAGWEQIRRCPKLLNEKEEKIYKILIQNLRNKMIEGVYDYGFLKED